MIQIIFVRNFVKNQQISMPLSMLGLKMNGTCDGVNLAHLTKLMLLKHYLAKFETPKMHMNKNSAFN